MTAHKEKTLADILLGEEDSPIRYVLESDNAEEYKEWCKEHGIDPSDESAEFYLDQTEVDAMERQDINDENYGIWL